MPSDNVYLEHHVPTHLERTWKAFRNNTLAVIGFWFLGLLVFFTLVAPWLAPFPPQYQTEFALLPPSWDKAGSIEFFLGTDDLSRDILSRLIAGSRLTFGNAVMVALSAGFIGTWIGIMAGMTKGMTSSFLHHLLDTILSLPSLLIAVIVVTFFGVGETSVLLAVWLALIPRYVRTIYIAVHQEMKKEYVLAARLDGANSFYILYYSVLPNILVPIATEFTRAISVGILDIAALGFLGLGAHAGSPEWGTMMSDSLDLIFIAPWTVSLPGIAITVSVLVVNLVGEGIIRAIHVGTE